MFQLLTSRVGNKILLLGAETSTTGKSVVEPVVHSSRLAQLVERKTLNLVVVGSSPTVGVTFCIFCTEAFPVWAGRPAPGHVFAPVAQLAARRSHNPKVASSILAGSILFFLNFSVSVFYFRSRSGFRRVGPAFGWMAERSKALV